jgi:hypothetical protein
VKSVFDLLSSVIYGTNIVDVKSLPTQGYFYPKDFEIKLKRASVEDIIEYEFNFKTESIIEIIEVIKSLVRKNLELSKNYKFEDLKSIDIIYVFLELVKFTNKKPIKVNYPDELSKKLVQVDFSNKTFNYFDFSHLIKYYDSKLRHFNIDGYKFSMPSLGTEESVTRYLIDRTKYENGKRYDELNYDFIFFLGGKKSMSFSEIENLIHIFNFDMEESDMKKVRKIVRTFQPIQKYSLKRDGKVIDINSKIDLEKIWK